MSKKRFWLAILAVLLSGGGLVTLFISLEPNANTKPEAENTVLKPQAGADTFSQMILKLQGAGVGSYWELHVKQLDNLDKVGVMDGITGCYFKDKKPYYKLWANSGKIYWQTHFLAVNGAVRLTSPDGKELTAENLTWDSDRQQIVAERNVILKNTKTTIQADKLSSDLGLEQAKFEGMTSASYLR